MDCCIGVVLSVVPFRERDSVVTVFSPGGIVKFFVRKGRSSLLTILTEGEFVFAAGKGDLYRFRDGTILEQHLRLRERFENVEAAGKLAQVVLRSQMPGKSAPQLYRLFCLLLRLIPDVERPGDLAALFQLKTLKHEGVFQQLDCCSLCNQKPLSRYGGERFCALHAPRGAIELSVEDEEELSRWAEGRSLTELLARPFRLHTSVQMLFDQVFSA